MSSGSVYYNAYKTETEKNNVTPEIISGFEECYQWRKTNPIGEVKSHQLRFWTIGAVHFLADGRVVEVSQTNSAIGTPLLAIFNNQIDYFNYRKAMPLNFYLNH